MAKEHVQQANLDSDRIASCFRSDAAKKLECAKGEIMRFDFLEMIVRLALLVYTKELNSDKNDKKEQK